MANPTWWHAEGKLSIREEPEASAEIVGDFLPGDTVRGLHVISNEWIEIDTKGAVRFESDGNTQEQEDISVRGFVRVRNRFRELLVPAADTEVAAARWVTQVEERTNTISWLRPPPRSEAVAAQYSRPLLQGGAEEYERRWELQEVATKIVANQASLRNYSPEDLKIEIRRHIGNPPPSWLEPLLAQKSVVVSMLSTAISQLGTSQLDAPGAMHDEKDYVPSSESHQTLKHEAEVVIHKSTLQNICRTKSSDITCEFIPLRESREGSHDIMSLCTDTSHFTEMLARIPWADFSRFASTCSLIASALRHADWRRLLEVLAEQSGLLLPRLQQGHPASLAHACEWRSFFFEVWTLRKKWCIMNVSDGFRVRAVARLKPGVLSCSQNSQIFLPLHQRLQLVKLGLDNGFEDEVARRMGVSKSVLASDKCEMDSDESSTHARIVTTEDARVLVSLPGTGLRYFDFERVFDGRHSQADVYCKAALPAVEAFLRGFSACVLCYGQTGSGKTHTMFGGLEEWASIKDPGSVESSQSPLAKLGSQSGLAPRAIVDIFASIGMQVKQLCATVEMSYIEIYQDHLMDLFSGRYVALFRVGQGIAASEYRESTECGGDELYHLQGAEALQFHCIDGALQALALAERRKHRAATALNARSSRAHSVLMLGLRQQFNGCVLRSRLHLVDLGGSEQVKKSKAEGVRFNEAVEINSSLMVLGRVVDALLQGRSHVPYYESKLTMLLQPALGGNAQTTVIITASPCDDAADETVHSLRFGERCSRLTNAAHTGTATMAEVLASLETSITACEAEIAALEAQGASDRAVAELGDGKLRGLGFGHNESRLMAQSHDDGTSGQEAYLPAVGKYTMVEDAAGRWITQQDRLRALRQRHREILGY